MDEAEAGDVPEPPAPPRPTRRQESRRTAHRRDRLLSALNISMAGALLLALPFALQAGSVFFLPLAAGLTFGLMLVPVQVRLERVLPATLAATVSLSVLLGFVAILSYIIVMPALTWLNNLPVNLPNVRRNIAPILDMFDTVDQAAARIQEGLGVEKSMNAPPPGSIGAPTSVVDAVTGAAPSALIQTFFALLILVFFLASYSRLRQVLIDSANTVSGAKTAEQVLTDVATDTGRYVGTITIINVLLGIVVALIFWWLEIETPWMWGGLAGLLNFVPYVGPVVFFFLAGLGGMAVEPNWIAGMVPALAYLVVNLVEAYIVTPAILGRRFLINPLLIMIALSFWGWVWGAMGALLSVPLLIIARSFIRRVGGPNVFGFLLDQTTLMRENLNFTGSVPAPMPAPAPGEQEKSGENQAEEKSRDQVA
ncbi:AI-2E family transporter [Pacificimonas flava]|uniref:AI-2E family transporter n=1 Tax=Pacificimonas flava TaxID=1234595 RepID=M2TC85_9SPHN|nr:AI-2E family transporter [Pacificimonas flava]EMD84249.1 hypothetical protein C725_0179 [Pacificimonas flava]MBB5279875.1 putative PurR-regulated permease PerM [Pacificimonas flava]